MADLSSYARCCGGVSVDQYSDGNGHPNVSNSEIAALPVFIFHCSIDTSGPGQILSSAFSNMRTVTSFSMQSKVSIERTKE